MKLNQNCQGLSVSHSRRDPANGLFGVLSVVGFFFWTSTTRCFVHCFRPCTVLHRRRPFLVLQSSVGPPGKEDGPFGDFLMPKDESENMFKAREYLNENSLPISYDADATETANVEQPKDETLDTMKMEQPELRSADATLPTSFSSETTTSSSLAQNNNLLNNPYIDIVSKISPSELISKFSTAAHPRVQSAVRNTIMGLLGGLPKLAFDTTTITTGQKLASLMFQLQMTGYMFKNADYRLSLEQSLGGIDPDDPTESLLRNDKLLLAGATRDRSIIDPLQAKQVRGKLRVKFSNKNSPNDDDNDNNNDSSSEVDAAAYVSELRSEVSKLRQELVVVQKEKADAVRKDLLLYIRTLPQRELQSLTNTMSPEVLNAMKGLVNAVLSGIGEGEIRPDTITEQSSEAMAQLCMWQLVIGYNLRTLEVREEIKKSLKGTAGDADGGISFEPGALE